MKQARSSGFTIIEVLIVLAVTALLFLGAAALISGRASQTEFDQSSRDFQQQIQNAISQIESGKYNNTDENCTVSGASLSFSGNNGNTQGTDDTCIFIGSVLQFGLGSDQSGLETYVLGGQRESNGSEVTGLSNALPTIVKTGGGQPDVVPSQLEYGLHPYTHNGKSSMNFSTDGGRTFTGIGAFALVYSFAGYQNGTIVSGAQQVNVVPVFGSTLGENTNMLETAMTNYFRNNNRSPDNPSGTEVTICARSGSTNQYALVTIGGGNHTTSTSGNNGQLSVTLTILGSSNNTTCP